MGGMEASEDAWSSIREWQAGLPAACQEVPLASKSTHTTRWDPSEWSLDRRPNPTLAKVPSPLPPLPPKDTSALSATSREGPVTNSPASPHLLNNLPLLNQRQQSPVGSSVSVLSTPGPSNTMQNLPKGPFLRSSPSNISAASTLQQGKLFLLTHI